MYATLADPLPRWRFLRSVPLVAQATRLCATVSGRGEDDSTVRARRPGCLRFDVLQDQADDNHFYFYEVYRDEAAFQAHGQAPHFARWRAARSRGPGRAGRRDPRTTLFPARLRVI